VTQASMLRGRERRHSSARYLPFMDERGAELLNTRLGEAFTLALNLHSELADEDGELPDAPLARQLELFLSGGLASGQRVLVSVWGTGRVFPEGLNVSPGTILKHGQTEFAWLIQLDQPFGEHEVVNLPAVHLRALEPEEERYGSGPRGRPSALAGE